MKKKGVQHIEVILAFVFFIGFVFIGFYFFSPMKSSRIVDSSLSYAYREITEDSSIVIERYSIVVEKNNIPSSTNYLKIIIDDSPPNGRKARVEEYDGSRLKAQIENSIDKTNLIVEFSPDNADNIFVLTLAKDINENSFDIANLNGYSNQNSFKISSLGRKKIISEARIKELVKAYDENYLELKRSFNLPNRVDFTFELVFFEGGVIKPSKVNIPQNLDVFSDLKKIEVIREDGSIKFADFIIKVW